jgi:hypothetical protein
MSGAEARNRTEMVLPPLDFESSASTSFATSAEKQGHKITFFMHEQAIALDNNSLRDYSAGSE